MLRRICKGGRFLVPSGHASQTASRLRFCLYARARALRRTPRRAGLKIRPRSEREPCRRARGSRKTRHGKSHGAHRRNSRASPVNRTLVKSRSARRFVAICAEVGTVRFFELAQIRFYATYFSGCKSLILGRGLDGLNGHLGPNTGIFEILVLVVEKIFRSPHKRSSRVGS